MRRIHIVVEGQTEEAIVRELIGPLLGGPSTSITQSILTTSRTPAGRKHKGGVSKWSKIEREIHLLLADTSIDVLTTMIDYYGMPADAPGMSTRPPTGPAERVRHVEAELAAAVSSARFRPHLTLHETESWVLAVGDALARHFGRPQLAALVASIVEQAGGPELVNDGPNTAPSKRLADFCSSYGKVVDGPIVLRRAGLDAVLSQCPHAAEWIRSMGR